MLTIKPNEQRDGPESNWIGPAPWMVTPPPGPIAQSMFERGRAALAACQAATFHPLMANRAHGSVIEDVDGNRYLDFAAGLGTCLVGHTNGRIVGAIKERADRLIHDGRPDFQATPAIHLAERLAALAPGPRPKRVFLTSGNTESIEVSVKLARRFTGRRWLVGFTGAYHGWSLGALSLSSSSAESRRGFGPLLPKVAHLPYGELDGLEERLRQRQIAPGDVAAIVVEPILGEGGIVEPPEGFLVGLREFCCTHGVVMVADESLTGMGRTGELFACERAGVAPDVVVLGAALGNGVPVGAVIAPAEIMEALADSHSGAYGGNPVGCVAGCVVLHMLEHGLLEHVARMGDRLRSRLDAIAARHRGLGNVRGVGLLTALDAVKGGHMACPSLRERILHEAFGRGLILMGCGRAGIHFTPPLCINETQLDVGLNVFEEAIATVTPL